MKSNELGLSGGPLWFCAGSWFCSGVVPTRVNPVLWVYVSTQKGEMPELGGVFDDLDDMYSRLWSGSVLWSVG